MKVFLIVLLGVFVGLMVVRGFMLDPMEEIGFRIFLEALSKGKLSTGDMTEISESATFTKFMTGAIIGAILGGFFSISLVINSHNKADEFRSALGSALASIFSIIVLVFIIYVGMRSEPKNTLAQNLPQQINTQLNSIMHVGGLPDGFYNYLDNDYANRPNTKAIALAVDNKGNWAAGIAYGNISEVIVRNDAISACVKRASQNNTQASCRLYAVGTNVCW